MYLHRLNKSNVFCSEPPEIISDLKNQTVQLGSDIRFKCNASGNPTPIIRWYHNDTLIILPLISTNASFDVVLVTIFSATHLYSPSLILVALANTSSIPFCPMMRESFNMDNITGNYFNESECIGFEDCVSYAFNVLDDLFYDDTIQNSQINRNLTSHIKSNFQTLVQNILTVLPLISTNASFDVVLVTIFSATYLYSPSLILFALANTSGYLSNVTLFLCFRGRFNQRYIYSSFYILNVLAFNPNIISSIY
jgi:hypothetical protein